MFPRGVRQRRVRDGAGQEIGRVVGLSPAAPGWLFVRLDGVAQPAQAGGDVVVVNLHEVAAMRPGEVALRLTLEQLLQRAPAPRGAE